MQILRFMVGMPVRIRAVGMAVAVSSVFEGHHLRHFRCQVERV